MPDVNLVRAQERWRETESVRTNRDSALNLVRQVLVMTGLTLAHHREQLSIAIWKWTEAEGIAPYAKYNTRYISEGVKTPPGPARINHEHVWTRKELVDDLMARSRSDEDLRTFLVDRGVACIVTVEEHARLGATRGTGWDRYVEAGIAVWDRATEAWLDRHGLSDSDSPAAPSLMVVGTSGESGQPGVTGLLAERADSPASEYLKALLATTRLCDAVGVPSYKKDGDLSDYFRIHDALIGEPTGAVAYAHWSGRVDFALHHDEATPELMAHPAVRRLSQKKFAVSCKMTDNSSRAAAEELLLMALDKLRAERSDW